MSFEVFEKLEVKVQQAIDTITLLRMELDELNEKNNQLTQELQQMESSQQTLAQENAQLREERQQWQERLHNLLGRMNEVN